MKPIFTSNDFWKFQYSEARAGGQIYLRFLRELSGSLRLIYYLYSGIQFEGQAGWADRSAYGVVDLGWAWQKEERLT